MNSRELERDGDVFDTSQVVGCAVKRGDRVRIRPHAGGEVFDLALSNQTAVVDAVLQDYDGKIHVAVLVEADPGAPIGPRRPGHRFFFTPEEVELLGPPDGTSHVAKPLNILVAGIGNIFHGDDGFGVQVAQRLMGFDLPDGVRVGDYGIRSYDLAYALLDRPDRTILIDACSREDPPGTLYVIQPDLDTLDDDPVAPGFVDAHAMNPVSVLRLARAMGAPLDNILIVGCEPEVLGGDEGHMGLSPVVAASVDAAAELVASLVFKYSMESQSADVLTT